MQKVHHFGFSFLCILGLVLAPFFAHADIPDLEVTGWIPYWTVTSGTRDAAQHLETLTEIHPFAYVIKSDGTLSDLADLDKRIWKRLFTKARHEDVLIIPTVTTSNGPLVHSILTNARRMKDHVEEIVDMVEDGRYDGVDINYEGKLADTNLFFALFLRELKKELGSKMLSCAIESRTPPESLYRVVPDTIEYANNLPAIGLYCDRVQIMTYDQQRADLLLNDMRKGAPYIPVSDPAWVRKVVDYMALSIPRDKMMLGIPTYGHEFEVITIPDQFLEYNKVGSRNPDTALDKADDKDVEPSRNSAGELSFSYLPDFIEDDLPRNLRIPANTPEGNKAAAQALAYAGMTGQAVPVYVVWWSDAEAIEDKVELADELGLRGVAIFKIDGHEDEDMWNIFE
ncbi:MAG: glycosyl hydrolase family 18 protein [Patescibacteria group bacterium]